MADTFVELFAVFGSAEEIPLAAAVLAILTAAIRSARTYHRRGVANAVMAGGVATTRVWSVLEGGRNQVRTLLHYHDRLIMWIAGEHPNRRLWHPQWLSMQDVYRDLRRILPTLRGRLLDVGCSGKPYAQWVSGVDAHVGVDVTPGRAVDVVIRDGQPWPFESGAFQSVLCAQVLQVVKDVPHLVREIDRVLEVGGTVVVTAPFVYNDMTFESEGKTFEDYWRHSFRGVQELFGERFEIIEARRQGGFGTTFGVLFLNWVQLSLSRSRPVHLLFALLSPIWLLICLAVNVAGWLVDKLDRTDVFYHNVLFVARKKALDSDLNFVKQ